MSENQFEEIQFPSSRQLTFDVGKIGREKHHVKALLEVDVTEARLKIKEQRQAGLNVSFFSWLLKVIADCVALHPLISGINHAKGNKVIVFREVDISTVVAKTVHDKQVPLPYVVRKANQKTCTQIYEEIESAKCQAIEDEGDYVLGKEHSSLGMRLFVGLPQWLRLVLMQMFVLNNAARLKNTMGTVMMTTAGMAGHIRGWIIPFSIHPLCLALGSINEQPYVYRGEIQKRQILHLTVLIDHDVIDGVPAAKFVEDLVRKIESGFGL